MTEDDAQAIDAIRCLIAEGRNVEAVRRCEDHLHGARTSPVTHIFEALRLTASGRLNEAVTQYEEALALAPETLPAYVGIADILADKGWHSCALVVLENACLSACITPAAQNQIDMLRTRLIQAARGRRETLA